MILDGHIHIHNNPVDQAKLLAEFKQAGLDGATLISLSPAAFVFEGPKGAKERLDNLMEWTRGAANLFPFYWIDPTEKDAIDQVAQACARGVAGFKTICNHFYPGDGRAMDTYRAIAQAGKPMLFHSGILWDGKVSSKYNRPVEFECMLDVPNFRFTCAHVSWPWVDECVATFGKIDQARKAGHATCEMFIDVTPGTPPIYREEALFKLLTLVSDTNIIFGSDSETHVSMVNWVRETVQRDNKIYDKLGVSQDRRDNIFARNLQRFIAGK